MEVAWLSLTPVKSMRLQLVEAIDLDTTGARGDRRFFVVDEAGELVNAKRLPALLTVQPEVEGDRLALRFADGTTVSGEVRDADETVVTSFYGRPVAGRILDGPWAAALSELAGKRVRLARTERDGDGYDRGSGAGASLVTTAALQALRAAAGVEATVDGRRFRMTVGIDGAPAHAEDGWVDRRVRLGEAVVVVREKVGRCSVTTRDPDTGVRDLDTLAAIAEYRAHIPTAEPLPFGVWGEVVEPGRVAIGDVVEPE